MWTRRVLPVLLLVLALGLVGLGVRTLLVRRLGLGDTYPAYSSLRADPLGTKILHDSFRELPGISVGRWLKPLEKLEGGPGSLLLHLGSSPWWWSHSWDVEERVALYDFARRGGTLIVAFDPLAYVPGTNTPDFLAPWIPSNRVEDAENQERRREASQRERVARRFGFALGYAEVRESWRDDLTQIGGTNAIGQAVATDDPHESLTCRTTVHFQDLDEAWQVHYEHRGKPVVMERPLGRGRVVLCAEAYLFSNEAMVRERKTELLSGWAEGCTNIWFAERHHGVSEMAGIMTLANRYRLQGALFALLLLAGLFVWRQATPLVPPEHEEAGDVDDRVEGRQSAEGLVHLLRRGVPPAKLLETCWQEWERGVSLAGSKRERMRQVVELARGRPGEAVAAYREASRIRTEKEW